MKRFRIRMTVEYEIERPDNYDVYLTDFQLNESGWCSDNALSEIEKYSEQNGCLCNIAKFEVLDDLESDSES